LVRLLYSGLVSFVLVLVRLVWFKLVRLVRLRSGSWLVWFIRGGSPLVLYVMVRLCFWFRFSSGFGCCSLVLVGCSFGSSFGSVCCAGSWFRSAVLVVCGSRWFFGCGFVCFLGSRLVPRCLVLGSAVLVVRLLRSFSLLVLVLVLRV